MSRALVHGSPRVDDLVAKILKKLKIHRCQGCDPVDLGLGLFVCLNQTGPLPDAPIP
jgi:hypothetical protein